MQRMYIRIVHYAGNVGLGLVLVGLPPAGSGWDSMSIPIGARGGAVT